MTGSIGDWYADREDSSFGDDADDERVEWHPHWDVDAESAASGPAAAEGAAPSTIGRTSAAVSEEVRQRILTTALLCPQDGPARLVDVLATTYTVVTAAQVLAVLADAGIRRGPRSAAPPRPARSTPLMPRPAAQAGVPRTRPGRPSSAGVAPRAGQIEHLRPLRRPGPLHAPRSPASQPSTTPSAPRPQLRRPAAPPAYVCPSCGTTLDTSLRCACS
jgi:hypothetical protein